MAALGIPTSRSLSIVSLPGLKVRREQIESAAVVCRVAPSWLRIGSFQIHNPPKLPSWYPVQASTSSQPEFDLQRQLVRYATEHVLGLPLERRSAKHLLFEVAERNARMIAAWQVYGFMHG